MLSVAIIPTKAARVRALAEAHPELEPIELAHRARVDRGEVRAALSRKDTRRKKSVAKSCRGPEPLERSLPPLQAARCRQGWWARHLQMHLVPAHDPLSRK